jgi:predicted PurR-regulated permease PerM
MAAPRGWFTREQWLAIALVAVTAIALYLCYRLVQPFLPAIAWALALAVIAFPFHRHVARRLRHPNVAAVLSVAAVALLVIGPIALISQQLFREASHAAEGIADATARARSFVESDHRLGPLFRWIAGQFDVGDVVQQASAAIGKRSAAILGGSVWVAMQVLITLFLLFYFLRDHVSGTRFLASMMPLSESEAASVFRSVTGTIRATVHGSLGVAAIQGFMGGLMFWILGLPSALFWGVVMGLFAIVPVLGTFVVWAPAAVFLALDGEWWRAAILVGWGAVAIGLIDNLLYPTLVGSQLRLHPVLVFFSVLGGIGLYGAAGVILGPLTLVVTVALVDIWRRRTEPEVVRDVAPPARQAGG